MKLKYCGYEYFLLLGVFTYLISIWYFNSIIGMFMGLGWSATAMVGIINCRKKVGKEE